jgi:multidrug efflux pump subunit AcrA (membrane-fusion protein)
MVDLSGIYELSLEAPSQVAVRETVPLKLRLKNVSDQPIELELLGRGDYAFPGAYDFVITKSDGTKVWQWLDGKVLLPVSSKRTLRPGQEMTFVAEWRQVDTEGKVVPAGVYYVLGYYNGGQRTPVMQTEAQVIVISAVRFRRISKNPPPP